MAVMKDVEKYVRYVEWLADVRRHRTRREPEAREAALGAAVRPCYLCVGLSRGRLRAASTLLEPSVGPAELERGSTRSEMSARSYAAYKDCNQNERVCKLCFVVSFFHT